MNSPHLYCNVVNRCRLQMIVIVYCHGTHTEEQIYHQTEVHSDLFHYLLVIQQEPQQSADTSVDCFFPVQAGVCARHLWFDGDCVCGVFHF